MNLSAGRRVAVLGATGYTGGFVVRELLRRGWEPVPCGRDPSRLAEVVARHDPGHPARVVDLAEPASLDRALVGVAAVVNAAGPFALTSAPAIEAALRAGVPYVGVAAEPDVVADAFERHQAAALGAGVPVAPACGFYGGLGDLLATAALGSWTGAEEVELAFALSSWVPTAGTRATIAAAEARRGGRRLSFRQGRLEPLDGPAPVSEWAFAPPFGPQAVAADFTTADCVTLSRHRAVGTVRTCMTLAPLGDLSGPEELRAGAGQGGGSGQRFLVEAVVRRGGVERREAAAGVDIYAASAPLAVEALERLVAGAGGPGGVLALGALGDARALLAAIRPRLGPSKEC